MVDIHCHILPGLDDGPKTLADALEMAKAAVADGITHVVATPHSNEKYVFEPELIRSRREELQGLIGEQLVLGTGCDFHMSYENLRTVRDDPHRFTINQKNYLLVEFADYAIPPTMDSILQEMLMRGISPVITHPERNPLLRTSRQRVAQWVHLGCFVQVTALSLLGRFGQAAQTAASQLLDEDSIHFVASDAHNVTTRPLQLKEARTLVLKRKGAAVADALFRDNPRAAFEGLPLPWAPEPPAADEAPPRKKRFFFF
jgi:protein-tyrosine phosphatase